MHHRSIGRLAAALLVSASLLSACGGGGGSETTKQEPVPTPAESKTTATTTADESGSQSVSSTIAQPVSATDTELVMKMPDGSERTFQVKPEDLQSVDPNHVASHVNVPEIAFRVYYETEGDVKYAVAAEEVDAQLMGGS
jgi:hypothetical protein